MVLLLSLLPTRGHGRRIRLVMVIPLCSPKKTSLLPVSDKSSDIKANVRLHSLELLQRVRIRPNPRIGGHGDGCVVKREGRTQGGRDQKCAAPRNRYFVTQESRRSHEKSATTDMSQSKQQNEMQSTKSKSGQVKRAVDLGKQTRPPPTPKTEQLIRSEPPSPIPPPPTPI